MVNVMGTFTLHQDHVRATRCPAMHDTGLLCVDVIGHERLGSTHIAADGTEWLEAGIGWTYLSDPSNEMSQAS